jgi:translocation and assembly module TamA
MRKIWRQSGLVLAALLCLSGCRLDGVPFLSGPDYKISGVEKDEKLNAYLGDLLDDRLAAKQPDAEGADAARQEQYRRHMIQTDLLKGLRAKGYYDGRVRFRPGKDGGDGTFTVKPGTQYHISAITIEPARYASYAGKLKIKINGPLDAQAVLDSEQALLLAMAENHCYFTLKATHTATIDRKARTGAITFHIDVGGDASFGRTTFHGQTTIKTRYLYKLLPWKRGDCFRRDKIESLRAALLESGLFSRAEAVLPDAPGPGGAVPVRIELAERAQHTIKAGLNYYTDEGAGITLGWEHRNLLGSAEKFDIDLGLSQLKQSLDLNFTKPYFLRKGQTLGFTNSLRRQDTDAYKETALDLGANISRKFNDRISGTTGAKFTLSRIMDKTNITQNYALFSLPQSLGYDSRDNALDPHKGWLLNGTVAPYFDVLGNSNPFFKSQLTASTYLPLGGKRDLILALRGNIGSIMGTTSVDVPATERFYSGGGGSVRGFGYQDIGPHEDGKATGGRSLAESAAELRFKLTETLGGVTFLDAGSVSDSAIPDFSNLSVGAGVGARYYTAIGPLRFDVGVPLNNRETTGRAFQIYISIGQAF